MYTTDKKYLKVLEGLGELLLNRDDKIQFNEFEIKSLKKKIEAIEKHLDFYINPTETTNEDYKKMIK